MKNKKRILADKLAEYYSKKFSGKVWCSWDESKRAYCIRGEGLPSHPDLRQQYPNGWSLLDFIKPDKASQILRKPRAPRTSNKRILSVTIRRMTDDNPDTSHLGEYAQRPTSKFSIDRAHAEDCAFVRPDIQQAKQKLQRVQQTVGTLSNDIRATFDGRLPERDNENYAELEGVDDAYDVLENLLSEIDECDCGERGDMERGEYRYFNPSFNYINTKTDEPLDMTPADVRKYVRQDYERMQRLHRGDWCYIGVRAEAEVIANVQSEPNGKWHGVVQTVTSGGLWGIEDDSERSYIEEEQANQLAELKTELLAIGFSKRAIATAFKTVEEKDS